MFLRKYLAILVGENYFEIIKLQQSTQKRIYAYALSIHLPVFMWFITSSSVSYFIFNNSQLLSIIIGLFCALTIYIIERIVIVTPKDFKVSLIRFLIGCLIAIIGASSFDLIIFDKEITSQLISNAKYQIEKKYNVDLVIERTIVDKKFNDWQRKLNEANCEANGTCGSRTKSYGPLTKRLDQEAELFHTDYLNELNKLNQLSITKENSLNNLNSGLISSTSGILERIKALHQYVLSSSITIILSIVFFSLILLIELMVIIVKFVMPRTIDDEIMETKDAISKYRIEKYKGMILDNTFDAERLLSIK